MRFVYHIAATVFIMSLAACTTRTGDLNLIATKNISSLKNAESRGRFEESDCKVFGIPNVEEAIDRTIEKGDGNALVDAVLYYDTAPFNNCFRAKGTVVKLRESGE
jgi:hypothetical protein